MLDFHNTGNEIRLDARLSAIISFVKRLFDCEVVGHLRNETKPHFVRPLFSTTLTFDTLRTVAPTNPYGVSLLVEQEPYFFENFLPF